MIGPSRDPAYYISHRPPVLCVEEVLELEEERATCGAVIRAGAHAPDGTFWELGLVEGLAQTAGVLNGEHCRRRGVLFRKGMLVGLRRFRVHRLARVGERVRFEVSLVKRLGPLTLMDGRARTEGGAARGGLAGDGALLCEGELKFYVVEEAAP